MADRKQTPSPASPETAQQLLGFMTNVEWEALLAQVSDGLQEVDNLPYPGVKEKVFALLQGIDSIHREALRRLVQLFKEGVLAKVVTDPAIHTLMELYDLLPPESITEENPPKRPIPKSRVQIAPLAPKHARLVSSPRPHWLPALRDRDALAPGECRIVTVDEEEILLCRIDGQFFALGVQCTQGDVSLADATLNGYTLVCPSHRGCYYDVRQGKRIGGSGQIPCYPIKVDDGGRILVGFGLPFTSSLPSM